MVVIRFIAWIIVPYLMVILRWRKMHIETRILGVVWSLVVIFSVAHGTFNNDSAPAPQVDASTTSPANTTLDTNQRTSNTTANETAQAEATAIAQYNEIKSEPHFGEPYKVGTMKVTVNSVYQYKTAGSGSFGTTANGMYWAVNVTVKNDGTKPVTVDQSMFSIQGPNSGDTTYAPNTTADVYANSNGGFFMQEINPGVTMNGLVMFDMPAVIPDAGIEMYRFVVSNGIFSKYQVSFRLAKR